MRARSILHIALFGTLLVTAGCTAPQPERRPEPRSATCADSIYLELSREHPDSLSDRAWERLQQLDAACARARNGAEQVDSSVSAGHHKDTWIWMPAMTFLGTLMWLMMGGGS